MTVKSACCLSIMFAASTRPWHRCSSMAVARYCQGNSPGGLAAGHLHAAALQLHHQDYPRPNNVAVDLDDVLGDVLLPAEGLGQGIELVLLEGEEDRLANCKDASNWNRTVLLYSGPRIYRQYGYNFLKS